MMTMTGFTVISVITQPPCSLITNKDSRFKNSFDEAVAVFFVQGS
jgi:hypothetical protein